MIGDSLKANPGNLFSNLAEAKKKLATGSYAGIYVSFLKHTCPWAFSVTF